MNFRSLLLFVGICLVGCEAHVEVSSAPVARQRPPLHVTLYSGGHVTREWTALDEVTVGNIGPHAAGCAVFLDARTGYEVRVHGSFVIERKP